MILIIFLLIAVCTPAAMACTDFELKATDGTVVTARSMEWGVDMKSQLQVHPRDEKCQYEFDDGLNYRFWRSRYGFVSANCYGLDTSIDGMNERGLSVGGLWFPGTEFASIPHAGKMMIDVLKLSGWMLGNFATVDEVIVNLKSTLSVYARPQSEIRGIPTIHFALHDADGKNAVIEFVDEQLKIYDNPNGVLTNAPSFDWHMTNLCNYLMLNPANPKAVTIGDTVLAPPGQGSGFMGIPGDWTPPSRFVRTTAMLRYAKPVANAKDGINLAEHILNAVDIPLGNVRPADGDLNHADYTQWALIKDLTNKVLYFRSYENMQLRKIDLKKVDFSPGAKAKAISIAGTIQ